MHSGAEKVLLETWRWPLRIESLEALGVSGAILFNPMEPAAGLTLAKGAFLLLCLITHIEI
jgi:hypothetical protein